MANNRLTLSLRAGDLNDFYAHAADLRMQLLDKHVIKDRTYHFKKYSHAFKGDDLVTFFTENGECQSRSEAVMVGCSLLMFGVIHHVVDDHQFSDKPLFYRFRRDDDTFKADTRAYQLACRRAVHIHAAMHASGIMIKHREFGPRTFKHCFVAREFIPWLMSQEMAMNQEDAVRVGKELTALGFIHHVCDDHDFKDDYLFFRFFWDELETTDAFYRFISTVQGGLFMGHLNPSLRLVMPKIRKVLRQHSIAGSSDMHVSRGAVLQNVTVMDHEQTEADKEGGMGDCEDVNIAEEQLSTLSLTGEFELTGGSRRSGSAYEAPVTAVQQAASKDAVTKTLSEEYMAFTTYLNAAPWFHGKLDRKTAVERLAAEPAGRFLVRESTNKEKRFVLSFSSGNEQAVHHVRINCWGWPKTPLHDDKPGFTFSLDNGPLFAKLDDLLVHYRREGSSGFPLTLTSGLEHP